MGCLRSQNWRACGLLAQISSISSPSFEHLPHTPVLSLSRTHTHVVSLRVDVSSGVRVEVGDISIARIWWRRRRLPKVIHACGFKYTTLQIQTIQFNHTVWCIYMLCQKYFDFPQVLTPIEIAIYTQVVLYCFCYSCALCQSPHNASQIPIAIIPFRIPSQFLCRI